MTPAHHGPQVVDGNRHEDRVERGHDEPIAVVGMACRFAGDVSSPEAFWNTLLTGKDAVGELPEGRWDAYSEVSAEYATAVRTTPRRGAFLSDISGFDADFFGISPREATQMDPQQRMLLEVSWEALEHAGIPPHSCAGTDVGVFVGVGADDYGRRLLEDLPRIEAWTGIGGAFCGVPNRISYTLDLRGPSLAVDTACSSSLVTLHLACQSLRSGEIPLAIVGGVLVVAAPGLSRVLDAAGAVSPDGRCKSFDASADGYGRGEGAGALILKRLTDARHDGDRVLAVVRGSAVHQDGKTPGIMAPSREAQEHLLRRAYRAAGISAATVDYVEAHGTGTRAGDPVEAAAMASIFGAGRTRHRPCLIGSVKPNIGHLEAGAGVAGVIKAVLALRAGIIPPSLNCATPNPDIPWAGSGLRVVTKPTPWPRTRHPRRAGVSGYGYGGTIAHVVLEQAPDDVISAAPSGRKAASDSVFPLSAGSGVALREYAARLADAMERGGPALPLSSVGHTLALRRTHLPSRAAIVAADSPDLVAGLRRLAAGEPDPAGPVGGVLSGSSTGAVWIFSGHGSHWAGMGRELLSSEPAFSAVLAELDPVFRDELGVSATEVVLSGDLEGVERIQPMIFAVQVALAAVWQSLGLRPAAVVGHSVGEIAAAVTAGVFDLPTGARLVCRRSRLLRRVSGMGAMVMVDLPFADVAGRLADQPDVAAAVSASPAATVAAGHVRAVDAIVEQWQSEGLLVRRVASDVAFHTRYMDPLLADLAAAVADLIPRPPAVPLYTTALDDPRAASARDGAYWAANLRNPVRFTEAVTAAAQDGHRLFLEVSAHPVVAHSISETLAELGVDDAYIAFTLRRGQPERTSVLRSLAGLYCHGAQIDWTRLHPCRQLVDLPPPAWQHRRYWAQAGPRRLSGGGAHDVDTHTLLGVRTRVMGSTPAQLWQTYLDRSCRPYPGDHPVQGVEIVPAAVLLNTFVTAVGGTLARPALTDVRLRVPVTVTAPREIQVVQQDGSVRLASGLLDTSPADLQQDTTLGWLTHTSATVSAGLPVGDQASMVADVEASCTQRLPADAAVARLASVGVAAMGFPWVVEDLSRGEGELFARVRAANDPEEQATSWAPILDAALSIASVVFPGPPVLRMPAHIAEVVLDGEPPTRALLAVRVAADPAVARENTVDIVIAAADGRVLARLTGLRYAELDGDLGITTASPSRLVHELRWQPMPMFPPPDVDRSGPPTIILVGDDTAMISALQDKIAVTGTRTVALDAADRLTELAETDLASGSSGRGAVVVVPAAVRPGEPVGTAATRAAWLLTRVAGQLAERGPADGPRLWCITQGVRNGARQDALGHAPLWGLGRVIAGEHPELWGGVVDLDPDHFAESVALLPTLLAGSGEDVVALRGGEPLVARLAEVGQDSGRRTPSCRPDGTYLITGGLGSLGLEVASWLAGRGARRLVLAGRRALPPRDTWDRVPDPQTRRQIEAVRSLEALGVTVRTVALDIADREQTAQLLSAAALGLPPIRGVVHAAGVLDSRMVRDVDEASLQTVMGPKVDGAWVLHELFPPGTLDFLVLFSSCGLLLGLPGQASYAAGNAFLDALARMRRAAGDSATVSLAWTSWRGLGMATSSAVIDVELAARGTAPITASEAFRCWEYAQQCDVAHLVVLRTIPLEPGATRPPLLSELPAAEVPERAELPTGTADWRSLPAEELRAHVLSEVIRQIATEMKLAPAELDLRRPLVELGLDSVLSMIIRRRLGQEFQIRLPATLLWDCPTAAALADHLAERLTPPPAPPPAIPRARSSDVPELLAG